MQKERFYGAGKVVGILIAAAAAMFMLYSARHAVSASLLPLIKYFDRLIRISMAGMKEEMTVYKLICFGGFSFLYGFIHAAGPGHGKSIVSAYFLSHKQHLKRAFVLAGIISATHILLSVILSVFFAACIKSTGAFFKIQVQGYLIAASGLIILSTGIYMLIKKLLTIRDDKHPKESIIYENPFILGISTGMVPCPVTVFIMTFAISRKIPIIGLVSVSSLAAGMFTLLSLVGAAAIKGRDGLLSLGTNKGSGRFEHIGEIIELISLTLIIFVGGGMAVLFLA